MPAEPATYANCPRCRLSIRVLTDDFPPVNCPRCLARKREVVELFVSGVPFRLLTGERPTRVRAT